MDRRGMGCQATGFAWHTVALASGKTLQVDDVEDAAPSMVGNRLGNQAPAGRDTALPWSLLDSFYRPIYLI